MITLSPLEMRALCASKLFVGYSAVALAVLLDEMGAQRRTFANNEIIASECDATTSMGVVLSGGVYVYGPVVARDERHIHCMLSEGGVVGATMVNSSRKTYPATLIGHGKGSLAVFSLAKIRSLSSAGREVKFFANLRHYLSEQLLESWLKSSVLSWPGIAERVMVYLMYRAHEIGSNEVAIPSTEEAFANYLGVNRSALSRVLGKLKREGKISYRKNVFTLLAGGGGGETLKQEVEVEECGDR